MSLDATFPLLAFSDDYSFTLEIELEGDVSGDSTESFAISESAIQLYGTTVGGEAAAGTLLAEIQSDIDSSAFAGDFPDYGDAVFTWQHGPGKSSLLWSLAIDIGETAVAGSMAVTVGDSRVLGIYSASGLTATAAGTVLTFTGEFTPHGLWAPCMPNELQQPDREYVQRTARNPRDLSQFSRIQHAQNARRSVLFRDVSGFYRDDFKRGFTAYQAQAGFDSGLDLAPNVATLETMLDKWAAGSSLKLYTSSGSSLDVDIDFEETFRISDLANASSAGGSRFDVELPLVDV
jgi:hypothetical protein